MLAVPVLVLALSSCGGDPAPRTAATPTPLVTSQPPTLPADPGASPVVTATATPSAGPTATPTASTTPAPTRSTEPPDDPSSPRPPLESAPPVGLPACEAGALTVTDADARYGADTVQELFTVRTTGPDCQIAGTYPAAQVLDGAGASLGSVAQGGFDLPAPGGAPVTLSRSTSLSFFVGTQRDGTCVPAASLVVTLPGTGAALRAPTSMQVCDGALGVGPVQRLGDDE